VPEIQVLKRSAPSTV